MDLLTALAHELGHLLGHDHEADGVMVDALAAGTRPTPSSVLGLGVTAVRDWIFADLLTSVQAASPAGRSSRRW